MRVSALDIRQATEQLSYYNDREMCGIDKTVKYLHIIVYYAVGIEMYEWDRPSKIKNEDTTVFLKGPTFYILVGILKRRVKSLNFP